MTANPIRDQKSVWFISPESERTFDRKNLYERLDSVYSDVLPRDISLHVMPIGGTSRARKQFGIKIRPENEKLERVIASALAERPGGHYARDIEAAVCDFVQRVAARLMEYGKAVFEMVQLRDRQTNDLTGYDLFEIDVRSLVFSRDHVNQKVPPKVAVARKVPENIQLDFDRLAVFSLPRDFEHFAETKELLAHLGGGSLTRMYESVRGDDRLGYDIKEHIRSEHLAIAAATRSMGWSASQNLYELFTEYYVLYRRLAFEGFVITLRDSILASLDAAIGKMATHFGTTAELEVSGLPTMEDVRRAKTELAAGDRTFNSVLDDFSLL